MRLRPNGDETQALQGIAKRNEARREGCQEVAASHSSCEAGERPFRTPGSEGDEALWAGSWKHAEDTEPHQRVTAKRPNRVRDSDHNVTNRKPLRRARPDLWELQGVIPGATRPHGAIPDNLASILDRLGLDRPNWVKSVRQFVRMFKQAAGRASSLALAAPRCSRRWFQEKTAARAAFI